MSTSLCGKICITLPKCLHNERWQNYYSRCSIVAAMSWRRCLLRCESKTTLFGLPKVDTTRNQWLSCIYNTVLEQLNQNIRVCAAHFMEDYFLKSSLQCNVRVLLVVCLFSDHKCRHGNVCVARCNVAHKKTV